jgi:hypothetical protein
MVHNAFDLQREISWALVDHGPRALAWKSGRPKTTHPERNFAPTMATAAELH